MKYTRASATLELKADRFLVLIKFNIWNNIYLNKRSTTRCSSYYVSLYVQI